MKRKIKLYLIFLICSFSCLAQIKEDRSTKDNRKKLFVEFWMDNKMIKIDYHFKVFLVNERDTIRPKITGHRIMFPALVKDSGYCVVFKFKEYNLLFSRVYKKMIFPGQDMTWKFGIENRPFNDSLGLLREHEYKTDKKTRQLQYLQLDLMEYGDGLQFVNKIE